MGTVLYAEDPKRFRQTVKLYKTMIENPDAPLEEIIKGAWVYKANTIREDI
jgi:hypothetical protein